MNVHEIRTPRTASRAQVSCWTPFESLLAGGCITECSHAVWRGLGSMLHNALRGARIGEASHPEPFQQPSLQGDFDPHRGVRIGEAANPGPKNSGQLSLEGLDLKAMLLPLITELIKQAVAEALGGVLPSSLRHVNTRQPTTSGPGTATKPERPKGGAKRVPSSSRHSRPRRHARLNHHSRKHPLARVEAILPLHRLAQAGSL